MIYLLHGENEFLKHQRLIELTGASEVQRYDGEDLQLGRLNDVLLAQSLFTADEIIVLRELSANSEVWSALPELAEKVDRTIILLEIKPDKRTKTYKWLTKNAKTEEFATFSDRQKPQLAKWLIERAKTQNVSLNAGQAEMLIDRLGYDQLRLDAVVNQLALAGGVTDEKIDAMVPLAKSESVFELFEAALKGDVQAVHRVIAYLEATDGDDGAYMTLGLLVSQLVSLNGLVLSRDDSDVASDLGVHPYGLKKLAPLCRNLSTTKLRQINQALSVADRQMKTTNISPWLLLEAALVKTAQIVNA